MMKICFIAKRYYTNKDLIADRFGRLFHLPFQLVKMGHEGLVITGNLRTSKKETVKINGLNIYSLPLSIVRLLQFIRECNEIIRNFKPDMVIASGDSYFGYIGLKFAQKLDIPFVFDVYDDYTAFGTNKIPGMKSLFYKAVQDADLVITAGDSLYTFLQHRAKSITSIENGFDPQLFHSIPVESARHKLNIPSSEVVIGYFGSLEPELGLEDLIEASRLLGENIPKVRLLMAGQDNLKLDYASFNVDYRGFLPQDKIPVLINACDVVVIPYLPSKIKQWCNACKIAEYVACHKPVVATDIADHSSIFASAPQSICEPGNPKSMAAAIQAQLDSPQLVKNTGNLTWKNLAEKLSAELLRLVH